MARIRVLDQNMINMIAAGEVIERPASVVKELVENSLDAGATHITIGIEDGGRKLISVSDNGFGMDAEDLEKAFDPHATSKLSGSDDLGNIATLGFRGEALASVSSVARIRTVTRTKQSSAAYCLEIDCGQREPVKPTNADYGTTIEVRDLFYKLPARRKFLRTANTEMGHISEMFTRIALANPDIRFTLFSNNRRVHDFAAGQSVRERIRAIFKDSLESCLLETIIEEKGIKLKAFLAPPSEARTNNRMQYVFLNGRFIRDKFISHALKEAYRGLTDPNRYPVVFLFLQMSAQDFDVNVHPTKIEVRFYNSNLVHSLVLSALREKLLGTKLETPGTIPQTPEWPDKPNEHERVHEAVSEFMKKFRTPSQSQMHFSASASGGSSYTGGKEQLTKQSFDFSPPQQKYLQVQNTYILTATDDGFEVIDQHAMHERILYENLSSRIQKDNLESQKLLIPESFDVTPVQEQLLEEHSGLFEKLGLEIAAFGPGVYAIQSFPVLLLNANVGEFIRDMLEMLEEKNTSVTQEFLIDEVLSMAACKAAIKAGQKLDDSEIEQLMKERENTLRPSNCPHGRPATIKFSIHELEKQFRRT